MIEVQRPNRRESLQESVQQRVKQFIVDNGYMAGDALPSEAELTKLLGVSRPSLREALRVLGTLGVVKSRHGQGTYVGRFSLTPFVDGLTFGIRVSNPNDAADAIGQMLEIREVLEAHLLRKATPGISDETIADLDAVVSRMEDHATQGREFSAEDRQFHQLLYRNLDATMIVHLIHAFWDIFDNLRQELPDVIGELSNIVAHHRAILEAVRAHDADRAVAALNDHFEGIRIRVRGQS